VDERGEPCGKPSGGFDSLGWLDVSLAVHESAIEIAYLLLGGGCSLSGLASLGNGRSGSSRGLGGGLDGGGYRSRSDGSLATILAHSVNKR
jgi:hypothetical protein